MSFNTALDLGYVTVVKVSVFMVSSETLTGDFPLARPLDKSKLELSAVLLDAGNWMCRILHVCREMRDLAWQLPSFHVGDLIVCSSNSSSAWQGSKQPLSPSKRFSKRTGTCSGLRLFSILFNPADKTRNLWLDYTVLVWDNKDLGSSQCSKVFLNILWGLAPWLRICKHVMLASKKPSFAAKTGGEGR